MIVGKSFIYVHLQKTGGSFISRELLRAFPESKMIGMKHSTLNSSFRRKLVGNKLIIGSDRDKYGWYRSLWSYGCDGKGGLRGRILSPGNILRTVVKLALGLKFMSIYRTIRFHYKVKDKWSKLLEKDNEQNFLEWFHLINHKHAQYLIGEPIPKYFGKDAHVGLYTRRFFKSYFVSNCSYPRNNPKLEVDFFINQATLKTDLAAAIELIEKQGEIRKPEFVISDIKVNTSKKVVINNEICAQIRKEIELIDSVF